MAENVSPEPITSKQLAFAQSIARGCSVAEASAEAGVADRTGRRWQKQSNIAQVVRETQQELHKRGMAVLLGRMAKAIATIDSLMNAKSELVRLQAASKVLDILSNKMDTLRLEQEIEELRQSLDVRDNGDH